MRLEQYRIESLPSFGTDYIEQVEAVLNRFDYDIHHSDVWEQRALWLDRTDEKRIDKQAVAKVLDNYNRRIGNSEQAIKNIHMYAEGKVLTVIGGQQACLFTGPMFVIYKAITVIQTAKQAALQLNRPVIPLFWIAGEDHDWAEVNELYLPSKDFDVTKIELPIVPQVRRPVTTVSVQPDHWKSILLQMRDALIETEFTDELFAALEQIAEQSNTIVDCFARMLAYLFREAGLVLLDSGDPALRHCEKELFSFFVMQNDRFTKAVEQGTEAIVQLGYKPQAAYSPESTHLFYIYEGERAAILRRGDRFEAASGTELWDVKQLNQLIHDHPERFSNNVLSRPLMQEALFPVLAVVLGRSEIAYWGQLKEAFHLFEMRIPPVISRTEVTIVEGTIEKQLQKLGWDVRDVLETYEQKRTAWLAEHDELELDELFTATRAQFLQMYEPLLHKLTNVHPSLDKLGQKNKQKILEQMFFLEKRARDALASKHEASLRQMQRIQRSLQPLDRQQERVHNIVYYLNKFGMIWLSELSAGDVQSGRHYALYLP